MDSFVFDNISRIHEYMEIKIFLKAFLWQLFSSRNRYDL